MRVLITGGAGFIGCNAAKRFLDRGDDVIIFDDMSRRGADKNLQWLKAQGHGKLSFIKGDIRNEKLIGLVFHAAEFRKIDLVLHMAAQVAVTTSVTNPRLDFETNAAGTFNLLEAIRLSGQRPVVINASTNKVYGEMAHIKIKKLPGQYRYVSRPRGISEAEPVSFYSPYGCSKGAAEQYALDYSRIYGIRAVNFRQSCIYGPRQFGIEDQGWVAHFIIRAVLKKKLTIYGDGAQVRDILYIDDLIDAFVKAHKNINKACGNSYNIGGGPANTVSLLEFIALLEDMLGSKIKYEFRPWRPADQKIYVSDPRLAGKDLGWRPSTDIKKGVRFLVEWVKANRSMLDGF